MIKLMVLVAAIIKKHNQAKVEKERLIWGYSSGRRGIHIHHGDEHSRGKQAWDWSSSRQLNSRITNEKKEANPLRMVGGF